MSLYSSILLYTAIFLGLYYQIFILVTFFEKESPKKLQKNAWHNGDNLPSVTVMVPCFNEEKTLEKTVLSLLALNYPQEKLFIKIIDDGSKDNTYAKALEMTKYPNIEAFTQKNGGKFTALNFGIRQSQTDIVGCLDADSTVHPDSLIQMIALFKEDRVMAVTPAMKVSNPKTWLQKVQHTEYNIGILLKKIMGKLDAIHVTPGPFSLFKKEIFEKIGYFKHAHNTEDMEIAFRIQENRYRIANCPTAYVYTITPPTFHKLYKQRTRWTYGFLKNSYDYKHMFLNKKYGNLGMLTLPFAIVSSTVALFIFSHTLYNFGSYIVTRIQQYLTAGFSFHLGNLDPFFFNTNSLALLTALMFCCTLLIIGMAWKLAEGKFKFSKDVLYFIALYGFLAPTWLAKAVYNVVRSKAVPWR